MSGTKFPRPNIQVVINFEIKSSIIVLEPVGTRTPKFSTSDKTISVYVREISQNFALLCPAQGFPVPAFR